MVLACATRTSWVPDIEEDGQRGMGDRATED
jgi:hypothetical protein